MNSVLTADNNKLYKMLDEINDRYKDFHISAYETDYLTKLQKQINTELQLRSADLSYHQCKHKHENGNCLVIGGLCTANGDGDSLSICQNHRLELLKSLKKGN